MFIIYLFGHYSDFINCFGLESRKIPATFAFTFRFLALRQHVFLLWFHAYNLLYVTSPRKQVMDVSLILTDSDTESENLSLLIYLSDGQKTESSKDVSFIIYTYIINLYNSHIS